MKSQEIQSAVKKAADAVAEIAGDGYVAENPRLINYIAIANVYPENKKTGHENFKNNTLLKAAVAAGLPLTKGGK